MFKRLTNFIFPILLLSFFPFPQISHAATLSKQPNNLGLVGYWNMNEGVGTQAHDFSGNGNNGTLVGATLPTWGSGKRGGALSFDGSTSRVNLGSVTTPANVTISAWIKTSSAAQRPIFSNRGSGVYYGITGGKFFIYYNSATPPGITTNRSVNDNNWHLVTWTSDGSTSTLYVDGQQDSAPAQSRGSQSGTAYIGWDSANNEYFPGTIDDLRIYNRALSATEIATLYNSGQVIRKNVSNQNLVGYWPMNEGRGIKANDFSGKDGIGTLNGSAGWTNGKRSKGLNFDGVNGSLTLTSNNDNSLKNNQNTVATWVYLRSVGPNAYAEIYSNAGNSAGSTAIRLETSRVDFSVNGDFYTYYVPVSVSFNKWYHLTVIIDRQANTGTVYLNGSYQGQVALPSYAPTGNAPMLGSNRLTGNGGDYMNGIIDDYRIYSRILSASEVLKLYQMGETTLNANQNSRLTSGLVGLWSFNGYDMTTSTSTDRSGFGNDGRLVNSPQPTVGKAGQGLAFNGTSSYVEVSNSASLNPSNLTASIWAKSNTATWNDYGFLISKRNAYIIHPSLGSTSVSFYIYTTTWNSVGCVPTTPITSWNMYTMTWDGTNLKCYINGVAGAPATPGGSINTSDTNVLDIGKDAGLARYFNGSVDEARIYNRALSANEVLQLYSLGR